MKVIGLTGTIASGKSTICEYLEKKGIPVVDSDKISREITALGGIAVDEVVLAFGEEILSEGVIDRRKLGEIVFSNEEKRELLEQILHPKVISQMLSEKEDHRQKGHQTVIFDLPLLIEANLQYLCDEIWVVCSNVDTQIQRLKARSGLDEEFSRKILANQIPAEEKLKFADVIIENNGSLEELYQRLDHIVKEHCESQTKSDEKIVDDKGISEEHC